MKFQRISRVKCRVNCSSRIRSKIPNQCRRFLCNHVSLYVLYLLDAVSPFSPLKDCTSAQMALIISTEEGQVQGKPSTDYTGGSFFSFLGIPYAKPPIGELRFKAPEPAEKWEGVKDCTKEGPECPSLDMFFNYYIGQEDNCLHLNVHVKELPKNNTLKPVIVWIHGGGFLYGSNKKAMFSPDNLMSQDIVLVSINYRLGVLGFLSLEDPELGIPGNAGLKDQVLALKWVQRNIEHFGGDPNNVTIMGESAGSASVEFLVLSPLAKGLFHKAIAQSGCTLNCWALGESNGKTIAKYLGYKEKEEKDIFTKLLKESSKNIVNAASKFKDALEAGIVRPYGPVIERDSEGAFLTQQPLKILQEGTYNKVPILAGYNSKEGIFYEIIRKTRSYATIPKDLKNEVPYDIPSDKKAEVLDKIKKFYFNNEECSEQNLQDLYQLKSDNAFVYGIYKGISIRKKTSEEPIYFYRMTLDTRQNFYKRICTVKHLKAFFFTLLVASLGDGYSSVRSYMNSFVNSFSCKQMEGVCHADDLGYLVPNVFCSLITPGSEEDKYVKKFLKLWYNFAKYSNPTPQPDDELDGAIWERFSDEEKVFEIGKELKMVKNPDMERIRFWDELYDRA